MAKYSSKKAYGDAEGPFGFPMPSAIAREVEDTYNGLPSALKAIGFQRRTCVAKALDLEEGERADISLVTSGAVDRDREVMIPNGGNWKQFLKNPVVTFAHRYDELPVGRSLWVKRVEAKQQDGWLAKTQYTTRPETWEGQWFPDAVWHFVKSGDLPGKSIGFLPLEGSPPDEKEIKGRPELAGVGFVIRKWLALEYAVAPVQSNPEALVQAAAKARHDGLDIEVILNEAGLLLPEPTPTFEGYLAELAEVKSEPDKPKAKRRARRVLTMDDVKRELAGADIGGQVAAQFDRLRGRV